MSARLTLREYFGRPETTRREELEYGVVREPPAPGYGHQSIVTHLGGLLDRHVRRYELGTVAVSPVDVVLDRERALVVQPDIVFVTTARAGIVRDRIWGAPDLVIEVLSYGTRRRDRTIKLGWYREYGVRECWLVDPIAHTVEVIGCGAIEAAAPRVFEEGDSVRSRVLPGLRLAVETIFE